MKTIAWLGVAYLAVVGAATFYSGTATNSPTADQIAALPSLGSLLGSTGTTAAVMDLAAAGALWFFVVK
jgi:hypothetical protein